MKYDDDDDDDGGGNKLGAEDGHEMVGRRVE